jgi:hypothetical protein
MALCKNCVIGRMTGFADDPECLLWQHLSHDLPLVVIRLAMAVLRQLTTLALHFQSPHHSLRSGQGRGSDRTV